MALAIDVSSNSDWKTNGAGFSWSHTCSGADRVLIVAICYERDSGDASGVTYGGTAMTLLRTDGPTRLMKTQLWYLANPATGANTVSVSAGSNSFHKVIGGAVSFTGADTGSPIDAHNGATGDSTAPSTSVTTVTNDTIVVDAVVHGDADALTPGAGQTLQWRVYSSFVGAGQSTEPKAAAGAVTMNWSNTYAYGWAISAVAIKAMVDVAENLTKDLADTVNKTDALIKAPGKRLAEGVAAADNITTVLGLRRSLSDSSTVTDAISKKDIGKVLAEAVAAASALVKAVQKALSDTATATAVISKQPGKRLSEGVAQADSISKQPGKRPAEVVTTASTITTKAVGKGITDTATTTESVAKATGKALADNVAKSDAVVKAPNKGVPDNVASSDSTAKAVTTQRSEAVAVADSPAKAVGKPLSDAVSKTDTQAKAIGKRPTEAVSVADSISTASVIMRSLAEGVAAGDSITKAFSKALSEAIAAADSTGKTVGKVLADDVAAADGVITSLGVMLALADSSTVAEQLRKAVGKNLAEAVGSSDSQAKTISTQRADSATVTDVPAKAVGKAISSPPVSLTDALTRMLGRTLSDGVSASDTLNKVIGAVLSDQVVITDSLSLFSTLGSFGGLEVVVPTKAQITALEQKGYAVEVRQAGEAVGLSQNDKGTILTIRSK